MGNPEGDEGRDPSAGPVAASAGAISPQLARSLQATDAAWRRLEAEFGLLTVAEVAELLGAGPSDVRTKHAGNQLLGVLRGGEVRFPGFQFDRENGVVLPIIAALIQLAHENRFRDDDLALWLKGPTTSFEEEDRPAGHLRRDPDAVLAAAMSAFEAKW